MLRLRLRGPAGKQHTCSLPAEATLANLRREAGTAFSLAGEIEVLLGFPPVLCHSEDGVLLSSLVRSGDTATVRQVVSDVPLFAPDVPVAPRVSPENTGWACALCTCVNPASAIACAACETPKPGAQPVQTGGPWACSSCTLSNRAGALSCEVCGAPGPRAPAGVVTAAQLQAMPNDNSCLFHGIAYLLDQGKPPDALRRAVAQAVRADPTWDEATLGKPREEYIEFIGSPIRWGGPVEIAIFAATYAAEIAVVQVQNGRSDVYGEGQGYGRRVYLLHSGIHFDAISFGTQREVSQHEFSSADAAARRLAAERKASGGFVDQDTMRLRCKICGFIAVGDLEARAHAGGTGHKEFAAPS